LPKCHARDPGVTAAFGDRYEKVQSGRICEAQGGRRGQPAFEAPRRAGARQVVVIKAASKRHFFKTDDDLH
jgi:hypothetical protein